MLRIFVNPMFYSTPHLMVHWRNRLYSQMLKSKHGGKFGRRNLKKKELLKMSPKIISDDNELEGVDPEASEDCVDFHAHGDKLYDEYVKDEKQHKQFVKKKIIERKYFRPPQEKNLLTWAAKEQVRYLHKMDPKAWSPERLAKCFPISETGVKKLLLSSFVPQSTKRILRHDKNVLERCKALDGGKSGPVVNYFQKLVEEEKIPVNLLNNAAEISSLPASRSLDLISKTSDNLSHKLNSACEKLGPYSKILKTYLERKKNLVKENSLEQPINEAKKENLINTSERNNENNSGTAKSINMSDRNKGKDSRTSKSNKHQKWFQSHEVEKELLKTGLGTANDEMESEFKIWLEKKIKGDHLSKQESFDEKIIENETFEVNNIKTKKFVEPQPIMSNLKLDTPQRLQVKNIREIYVYDNETGYQHPYGKYDPDLNKINIPKEKWKEGAVYKKGDCYYDDQGEFLYKVV